VQKQSSRCSRWRHRADTNGYIRPALISWRKRKMPRFDPEALHRGAGSSIALTGRETWRILRLLEMFFPFHKILCPVDFDENSLNALERAAKFARSAKSKLILLHVLPIFIAPGEVPPPLALYEDQRRSAEAKLTSIAREVLGGIDYEVQVDCGDVVGAISQSERKLQPDLIVMATHGRKGLGRMLLGSVAEGVLRRATCPVLTIRGETHRQEASA
jgi:nucleotide-binding universal stress UspA family protein